MSLYISYIAKIIIYFIFSIVLYKYLKKREKKNKKKKISFIAIIVFGFLFGLYGIICGPIPYTADRLNYALRFSNDIYLNFIKSNSIGLYFIYNFLHFFSYDPNLLFFFMGFIYFVLTMYAYNIEKESSPLGMLLLLLSTYGLFGFYMYKQAIAIVCIVIAFHHLKENKTFRCALFILFATLFHESAWISIPLFILLRINPNSKIKTSLFFIIILFLVLFFNSISSSIVKFFNFIPGIDTQLLNYLNADGGIKVSNNYLTALKAIPFYIILLYGFIKNNNLKNKIENYNIKMILTIFVCSTSILSIYNYWLWRFGAFFYFPVLMFSVEIYQNMSNKKEKNFYILLLVSVLFILQLKLLIQYYFIHGGII